MMHTSFALLLMMLVCVNLIGTTLFAASDDFIVRTLIGDDTEAPSVPTGLTATPVATTQIDLAWATSSDNFLFSGYQLFRDDVQIATTTVPYYADVGLTPSTTYTYFVTAFDSFNNISASSSPVATTTLASTSPPVQDTAGRVIYGSASPLTLLRLEVFPERDAVVIRYETRGYVRSVIRWGKTISYELGSLAERSFSEVHETRIIGLVPGMTYKFTIEGESNTGNRAVLTQSTFTTLPPDDVFPPANVADLRAVIDGNDVLLTWMNPRDADFAKVRVVRGDAFYPSDIADGRVVYEGDGETVRDTGQAIPGTVQYYTVFSYDVLGNISSGAVVAVRVPAPGGTTDPTTQPALGTTTPVDVIDETLNPLSLALTDLVFMQEGEVVAMNRGTVHIDGAKELTIMLPYDRVPEHLKTILMTLRDSDGKEFSFLLRINREKTAYTALLAPFGISDDFSMRIAVFDYKTAQLGYAEGVLASRIAYIGEAPSSSYGTWIITFFQSYLVWFVLFLLALLILAWRLIRHARA